MFTGLCSEPGTGQCATTGKTLATTRRGNLSINKWKSLETDTSVKEAAGGWGLGAPAAQSPPTSGYPQWQERHTHGVAAHRDSPSRADFGVFVTPVFSRFLSTAPGQTASSPFSRIPFPSELQKRSSDIRWAVPNKPIPQTELLTPGSLSSEF